MRFKKEFILFYEVSIFFWCYGQFPTDKHVKETQCIPKVDLKNCNLEENEDPAFMWYVYGVYSIRGIVTKTCESSVLNTTWSIYDERNPGIDVVYPGFYGKLTFTLGPYLLGYGKYTLTLTANEYIDGNDVGEDYVQCYIHLVPGKPIAVITGGDERQVMADKRVIVTGAESVNVDCPHGETCFLLYEWSCTVNQNIEFCKGPLPKGNTMIIPAKYMKDGARYEIKMRVRDSIDHLWQEATQVVVSYKDAVALQIGCLKNCLPVSFRTNSRVPTVLRAYCIENCAQVGKNSYVWKLEQTSDTPSTDSPAGNTTTAGPTEASGYANEEAANTTEFYYVKPNTISNGGSVKITLTLAGGLKGYATTKITAQKYPECEGDCAVTPTSGTAATQFHVQCKVKAKGPYNFHLYQSYKNVSEEGVLLATSETGEFKVYVSCNKDASNNQVQLRGKIMDTESSVFETCGGHLSVTCLVESESNPVKQMEIIEQVYEGKTDPQTSVMQALKANNIEKAAQMMNTLIEETRHIKSDDEKKLEEFKGNFTKRVLKDCLNTPVHALPEIRQLSSTIKNLLSAYDLKTDPFQVKLSSMACKQFALATSQVLQEQMFPPSQSLEIQGIVDDLLSCGDSATKPNNEVLQPEIIFNLTTQYPLIVEAVPTENYEDYEDPDTKIKNNLLNLEEGTITNFETERLSGQTLAHTMSPGEPLQRVKHPHVTVNVFTHYGPYLSEEKLEGSPNVDLYHSKDFDSLKEQKIEVVFTTYDEHSPMWWHKRHRVQTAVVDVAYYYCPSHERVTNFKEPFELHFKRVLFTTKIEVTANIKVPASKNQWTMETVEHDMEIHCILVLKLHGLLINFEELANTTILDFVVVKGRRPTLDDFKNSITVTHDNDENFLALNPESDSLYYMAVLPNKKMLKKHSGLVILSYKVAFEMPYCVLWIVSDRRWDASFCKLGKNTSSTFVQCQCFHASTIAASYMNPTNKVEKIVVDLPELSLYVSYLVFVCLCIVFGTYCIILILWIDKPDVTKDVIFLCDNDKDDRYAYLIVVKTGKVKSAGTTSNVGIKLYGDVRESKPHILNYPDPEKRLLQTGGEDWFVLTHTNHLGKIESVGLWFDSVGNRASWYCEYVFVYDMQNQTSWIFQCQQRFTVMDDSKTELILKQLSAESENEPEKKISRFKKFFTRKNQVHAWNILSRDDGFCNTKRLTILLSIVTSTYAFALILYGLPTFRMSDGFSYYGHFHMHGIVFLIACGSSILSLAVNFGIIMLFRNSEVQFPKKINGIKRKRFPFIGTIAAWVTCGTVIVISMTIIIVYGFWVARVTKLLWLTSTILSFAQSVILLEHVYIRISQYMCQIINSFEKVFAIDLKHVVQEIENQRAFFYKKFGGMLLRPYVSRLYAPLDEEQIAKKRMKELARLEFINLIQDLVMFVVYILLLYTVVLANKDDLIVYSNQEMKAMLVLGAHNKTMQLEDIGTTDDIYKYAYETFIPGLHSIQWYHTYFQMEPGLMVDYNTKVLGVGRFRQHRVQGSCYIPEEARHLNMSCSQEFSKSSAAYDEFDEMWKPKMFEVEYNRLIDMWKFKSDGESVRGEVAYYPSGGFSANLGRTLYNSYFNLKYIIEKQWIDKETRAIFLEFLSYNANYNVFNSVTLILEKTAAGYYAVSHLVKSSRFLFTNLELEIATLVAFTAFLVMLLIMVVKKAYGIIKNYKTYFKDVWNILDIVIIVMSVVCILLFVYRIILVGQFLEQLENRRHNEFLTYYWMFHLEDLLSALAGLLVCIATVRLWKLLRFGVKFIVLERTILYSAVSLLCMIICHLIFLLAFGFIGHLLFGPYSNDFKDATKSVNSLTFHSLNLHSLDYQLISDVHGNIGIIYYSLFMIGTLTITTLYVTIIMMGYEESCMQFSNQRKYTVQSFVKDELWYLFDLWRARTRKRRLRAGGDDEEPESSELEKVYPKSDEFRYADCHAISRNRMNAMNAIAKSVIVTKVLHAKTTDTSLMKDTVYYLFVHDRLEDEKSERFLEANDNGKVVLVDDNRLCQMEAIVNSICGGRGKEKQVKKFFEAQITIERFDNILNSLEVILRVMKNVNIADPGEKMN